MLSRPTITGKHNSKFSNNNTLVNIVIDDSYSSSLSINKNLKSIINKIIKSYNNNTVFKIQTFSDSFKHQDANISSNIIDLNKINSTYYQEELNIEKIIADIPDISIYSNIDIFVISDLQSNSIPVKSQSEILTENGLIKLFFIKTSSIIENINITDISVKSNLIVPNEIIDINATIHSSKIYKDDLEVNLFIDKINVGKNIINISDNDYKKVNFKTTIPDNGKYNCKLTINDPSPYIIDNNYYFTLSTANISTVCIVSDTNDDYYLSKALKAYNDLYSSIDIVYMSSSDYMYNTYSSFDTVIIFAYNNFNKNLFSKADSQTNNIIIVPDDNMILNNMLSDILNTNVYENINVTKLRNNSFVSINSNNISNDNLSALFQENKDDRRVDFFRFYNVPISSNTIISLDNGYSFLNKFIKNDNKIYILSAPLNLTSTNFPIKGVFIPFIGEIIKKHSLNNYYESGNKLVLQKFLKYHIKPSRDTVMVNADQLIIKDVGIHNITYNDNSKDFFAVNINPEEFDQTILTNEHIKTIFPESEIIETEDNIDGVLKELIVGIEIWRYFLFLTVFLVIIEMYLSNIYFIKND